MHISLIRSIARLTGMIWDTRGRKRKRKGIQLYYLKRRLPYGDCGLDDAGEKRKKKRKVNPPMHRVNVHSSVVLRTQGPPSFAIRHGVPYWPSPVNSDACSRETWRNHKFVALFCLGDHSADGPVRRTLTHYGLPTPSIVLRTFMLLLSYPSSTDPRAIPLLLSMQ